MRKPFWPWLIPIIAVVYTAWVVLLALDKTFGFAKAYEYFGFDTWLYLGSAIFIAFIVIMILFTPAGRKEYEEEEKEQEEKSPVTVEAVESTVESGIPVAEGTGVKPMEIMPVEAESVELPIESEMPVFEGVDVESPEQEIIPDYNIIPYPREVSGAIYAGTFIPLDEKNVLNMRTFIGRSCLLCDKKDECWENYKNTMTHDGFLSNIDCLKVKKHGENAC
ncbi:MAG: hypothetical protein KKE04_03270 [Candidatus Thermoplasmatota archaeon]|nr:hypothetical protein [Candidatus Thermoplasmatota archaeon]